MGYVPKTSRRELTPEQRSAICNRFDLGEDIPTLMRRFNRSRTTITSVLARYKAHPDTSFKNKPRSSRPKKTTDRQDRALVSYALKYPRETLYALCSPSKSGQQLGRNTVRKILKSRGKSKHRPRKKPWLSYVNIKKRVGWCRSEKKRKRDYNTVC